MKKRRLRIYFFLLLLTFSLLSSVSCGKGGTEDKFEFTERDFKVEIRGFINKNEVFATLYNTPSAQSEGTRALVRMHSPKALDGISVSLSSTGEHGVRLGSVEVSGEWARGLFEPFLPIIERGEIYSVQRNDAGGMDVRICDENCDLTYVFPKNSDFPSRIFGKYLTRNIDFELYGFVFDFD